MRPHRRGHPWVSGWLIVALLFMQLAGSAYACPRVAPAPHDAAGASMPGCDMHRAWNATDPAPTPLCKAHCQQGSQSVGQAVTPTLQPVPLLWAVLDWGALAAAPERHARHTDAAPSGAPPPGAPPIYLSLLVLRN